MRLRKLPLVISLTILAALAAAGLLLGTAGFWPEPQPAEAAPPSELKKLLASDAELFDIFGWTVAVSGDIAVVGAQFDGTAAVNAGAAYVFEREEGGTGNWGEAKKLTASDAQAGDAFGISVAVSGDTLVVGAYLQDLGVPFDDAGAAYVFQRNEGGSDNWGEVKKLTASNAGPSDLFGFSVAVNGDTAVVGAIFEDAGGSDAGAAYVFQRSQGGADNWGEEAKLTASDKSALDRFGVSVAVDANTLVVGANGEQFFPSPTNAGAAYVFQIKLSDPGDTDGDGCSDQHENRFNVTLGGLRDYKNPWDFYDVLGPGAALPKDGVIDLPNDILSVILHFSPTGYTPGTPSIVGNTTFDAFDRGPQIGLYVWNMSAPDGVIDLPNDILGVILQAGHDCR